MRSRFRKIIFPGADEHLGYRFFPRELEDDPLIFFHGTSERKLDSIIENGFWLGPKSGSTSFARNSELPLRYAHEARKQPGEEGCVIAVRFSDLGVHGIRPEGFGVDVWRLDAMPAIEAYSVVPASYVYR